jgi:type I restriction enzyme S subunit
MAVNSNSSWTETTLGEILEIFDYKRIPLSGTQRKERQGKYPYYGASGVIDYIDDYIFDGKYLLIAEDGENLNSRKLPVAFFASGKFWVNNHAHIVRAMPGIVDDYFIFAWFVQANISGYITGAAQPKLTQENMKRIALRLPPLSMQRKIAAILSAYDDLIENNLRRIKILEEMAQNIYSEWFVKFHFPDHQHARFTDSPLGRIPVGWEEVSLLSVTDVTYGFAFQSNQFNSDGNGMPVVRIRDVLAGTSDTFSSEEAGKKYLVENGDILVGMDGEFHMGFWVGGQAYLVQRVARFRSKGEIGRYHLFLALQEPIQHFNATITGTTVAHLGDKHIKTIAIKWPQEHLKNQFNSFLEPMLAQILNLRIKNITLRSTRDLLLSRLISGEVDVSKLDIAVPEEASA